MNQKKKKKKKKKNLQASTQAKDSRFLVLACALFVRAIANEAKHGLLCAVQVWRCPRLVLVIALSSSHRSLLARTCVRQFPNWESEVKVLLLRPTLPLSLLPSLPPLLLLAVSKFFAVHCCGDEKKKKVS